jgi:hypothetical protein
MACITDAFTAFSPAELKDIFKANLLTDGCQTRTSFAGYAAYSGLIQTLDDLLNCTCEGLKHNQEDKINGKQTPEDSPAPASVEEEEADGPSFVNATSYNPEPVSWVQATERIHVLTAAFQPAKMRKKVYS